MAREIFGAEAYAPREIAERVRSVGVAKAGLPFLSLSALGVLAGGFIGLGSLFFLVVASDASLGFAAARVLGGLVFSLGLILVVVAGAELFTGNNLMVMAWVSEMVTTRLLVRNLVVVYAANFVGAAGLAFLVHLSNHCAMNDGGIGAAAVRLAAAKTSLPFAEAFFKGVLCNILVCLAVWLAMAGRNVVDRILAVIFPVSAFVAAGFEHSIANMYFIPLGLFEKSRFGAVLDDRAAASLDWFGFLHNLVPVTMGNFVGGAVMVGTVYYLIYLRGAPGGTPPPPGDQ